MPPIESLLRIDFQTRQQRTLRRDEVQLSQLRPFGWIVMECERSGSASVATPDGPMLLYKVAVPNPTRHIGCWGLRSPDGATLLTQALALRKTEGDALWVWLHETLGAIEPTFGTAAEKPPTEPWLGVALHLPSLHGEGQGNRLSWLSDFERSVAWSWIDSVFEADAR